MERRVGVLVALNGVGDVAHSLGRQSYFVVFESPAARAATHWQHDSCITHGAGTLQVGLVELRQLFNLPLQPGEAQVLIGPAVPVAEDLEGWRRRQRLEIHRRAYRDGDDHVRPTWMRRE